MDFIFIALGTLFVLCLVGMAKGCAALNRRPS